MAHLSIVSGRIETDAEDNHHSVIFLCFNHGGYAFLSKAAFSNTTAIAKSNCENNFLQRIMASGAVADV